MIGGVTSSSYDLVTIGELVEEALKNGKIVNDVGSPSGLRKFTGRKKEGETNVVSNQRRWPHQGGRQTYEYQYVAAVAPVINASPAHNAPAPPQAPAYHSHHNQHRAPSSRQNNGKFKSMTQLDPIPINYTTLYPFLIQRGLEVPMDLPLPLNPPYAWYNANPHYAFHKGPTDHKLEACFALKARVQDLVGANILTFKDVLPNVKTNLLPTPRGPTIKSIEEEVSTDQLF